MASSTASGVAGGTSQLGMPQVQAQAQAQAPPTANKFDPMTGQPIAQPAPPTGNRFDPMTGQPIPKFNPDTGVQNWW